MKHLVILLTVVLAAAPAYAQARGQAANEPVRLRAVVTFGAITFTASDSFEAILDARTGPIFGGGGQVSLPWDLYVEVTAARFAREGERVFVGPAPEREVFKLGIPVDVTITPLEITGGWRYRHCPRGAKPRVTRCQPSIVPYVGGGFSSYRYQEVSEFAGAGEDVDERFNGFHLVGGVEYAMHRWVAIGGEVTWSSIADALGHGGVSAAFDEDNLGGTTFRLKISVGR